ncbi:MAG: branched-chain amino acid aminotransferase [bacterium]
MNIKIEYTKKSSPKIVSDMRFGSTFTDKMFEMNYDKDNGWTNPVLKNYEPFVISPATLVLHYGQEIFEGQKAYKWKDGRIVVFRPEMNIKRFNNSAKQMCMPAVDEELFMQALESLVWADRDWIPQGDGQSLYIRAAMIATDPVLGVRAGTQYKFFIINSPSGCYFPEGFNPMRIWVSDTHTRTVAGGIGEAKTGGNYAASLRAGQRAHKEGFSAVLFLDAKEKKYIDEAGPANFFAIKGSKYITPNSSSILPSITNMSLREIAKDLGLEVELRSIGADELGNFDEVGACGTAAVISPIKKILDRETGIEYNYCKDGKAGPVSTKLYEKLRGIQLGDEPDKFGWNLVIE